MSRCAILAVALMATCAAASAQMSRNFPADALRGEVVVTLPPELLLNGKPARLAPGARLRGQDNLFLTSGALVNQRLVVHYRLDLHGQIGDLWILTPVEFARRPWPTTPAEAAAWRFDPQSQTWSRP